MSGDSESEADPLWDQRIQAIREEFAQWVRDRIDGRRTCSLEELAHKAEVSDSTMYNLRYGGGSWHKLSTTLSIATALEDDHAEWKEKWSECNSRLEEAKAAKDHGVLEPVDPSPEDSPPAGPIDRSPRDQPPSAAKHPRRRGWLVAAGALASVVVTVAAVVVIDAWSDSSSGSNQRSAGCSTQGIGEGGTTMDDAQQIFMDCIGGDPTRRDLKDLVAGFTDVEPIGEGPWPFYVHVGPIGLKVRTSGSEDGQQVGTAHNGATLWVECRLRTGFTPDRDDIVEDVGPRWLRVRWPHDQPGVVDAYASSPTDPHTGYVYEAYAFPAGHNGHIPDCE